MPTLPLAIAAFGLGLWGFIEMYCLKGSRKTNRFGADPLTPEPPRDTRPPWDQQSEIEMVPHRLARRRFGVLSRGYE